MDSKDEDTDSEARAMIRKRYTSIVRAGRKYMAYLVIDQQSFPILTDYTTRKHAEWFRDMLVIALHRMLSHNNQHNDMSHNDGIEARSTQAKAGWNTISVDGVGPYICTTDAMEIPGGCMVRVVLYHSDVYPRPTNPAPVALTFVPGVCLEPAGGGMFRLRPLVGGVY